MRFLFDISIIPKIPVLSNDNSGEFIFGDFVQNCLNQTVKNNFKESI